MIWVLIFSNSTKIPSELLEDSILSTSNVALFLSPDFSFSNWLRLWLISSNVAACTLEYRSNIWTSTMKIYLIVFLLVHMILAPSSKSLIKGIE
jgi:hypothetical protein